jgi:hypothetical protein
MADGAEVGVAYVSIVPSAKGITSGLAAQMPAFSGLGAQAGGIFGKGLLSAVKTALPVAAVLGAVKGLYEVGQVFDEVSDTIRIGTGATGQALDGLGGSAKKVGKQVPANFSDVGTAIADVNTRLGLTGGPLEKISAQFLELSRITKTDVAGNVADVSRVFGDWSIATGEQSSALDKIFITSQATGIGIDTLSQKVVQFGAPLRQMGFGFEQSLALFGKFEKEGVNVETVMAGMRMGLANMARAGEEPIDTFGRVVEQIKSAGSVADANKTAIEVFGSRAGPDMAAAIREGRFELDDLVSTISTSGETIMAAGQDVNSHAEFWQIFKNKALAGLALLAERVVRWPVENHGSHLEDGDLRQGRRSPGHVHGRAIWHRGPGAMTRFEGITSFAVGIRRTIRPALRSVQGFPGWVLWTRSRVLPVLRRLQRCSGTSQPCAGDLQGLWPALQPLIQTVVGVLLELAKQVLPILNGLWNQLIATITRYCCRPSSRR